MERFPKIVNRYNYFHNISFSHPLLSEKKMYFFNKCLIFTLQVFVWCKNVWGRGCRGPGAVNFLYIYLLLYSNKLAYLQQLDSWLTKTALRKTS